MASWSVEEKQIPEQHLLSIRLTTKEDQVRARVVVCITLLFRGRDCVIWRD